nr:isopentenyltransferase 9 [Tanacetum cinerariifolium]
KEAPVVPEMRHQPSISALRKSKHINSEVTVPHKDDNLLNKVPDRVIQVPLNSSTSNQETVVMEQSACKDEKCDNVHELFLREDLENNEKSSELVDIESSQSDESYLDALLNSSTSSQEDFMVEQSSCKDEKCDDDHEKFFRELYENHESSLELLSYETLESDDSVSEDGDLGMKEKKFDI